MDQLLSQITISFLEEVAEVVHPLQPHVLPHVGHGTRGLTRIHLILHKRATSEGAHVATATHSRRS